MDNKSPEEKQPTAEESKDIQEKTQVEKVDNPEWGKVDPVIDNYYMGNPFFYEVANHFGIEQREFDTAAPKLSAIVEWVKNEYNLKDVGDILLKISEVENKIQRPQWGEKRYTNMYKYIRLAGQKTSVEKAMKALERQENHG